MMKQISKNSLLKISIGIVYLWFGALKFFPELSPAESLAIDTITKFTLGLVPENISILLLALIEVVIGICFLFNYRPKKIAVVALAHLGCTFLPLVFFNETTYNGYPIFLTLVGQYIIKNLIIIAAILSIMKERNSKVINAKMIKN